MCLKVKDMGPFNFVHQVNEMSEKILLKMGMQFPISLNMQKKKTQGSCLIMRKNVMTGHTLRKIK